MREPG